MKDRHQWITLAGHFVLLQLIWPAAVLGAVHGLSWPAAVVLLAMPVWSLVRGIPVERDLRMLVVGMVVGITFEVILIGLGLIEYVMTQGPGWVPLWIVILWGGFALNFNHCLAWLQGRWWLGVALGALGGPASVLVGVSLGAASLPAGVVPLALVYSTAWAAMVPLLGWLARRYREREEAGEGA